MQPNGTTNGTIVWEWHLWDHLIQDYDSSKANYGTVADHPELVDLNYSTTGSNPDWTHCNSIDYNPARDQILISSHGMNEIWVIDHSTTTAQAAGHTGGGNGVKGGDLLYRWGNPVVYRRGTTAQQKLFGQHDAQWIPTGYPGAGDISIFNNGLGRIGGTNYSTVDEITPPVDASGHYALDSGAAYGPTGATWTYMAATPTDFYGQNISGAQRLPNGNTLICVGPSGVLFEVGASGETLWRYVNPVTAGGPVTQGTQPNGNLVFKIRRYAPDHTGLAGWSLPPQGMVELHDQTIPPPVADGKLIGTAARFSRSVGIAGQIDVTYDPEPCSGSDAAIVYGTLGDYSGYAGCA